MTGDGDFAGEIVFAEGLDCAAGQAVIGGKDRGDVALRRFDGFECGQVGLGRQPIFGVGIGDDFDVATIDVRLQNFHLRIVKSFRAFVVGRTGDEDVIPFGGLLQEIFGLHAADFNAIKRDVEIDAAVDDQAIVTDDLDIGGFGSIDDAAGFDAVVRKKNENFDAGLEHVLDLLELTIVIATGVGGNYLHAELLGADFEGIEVGLPALALHGFDGETNLRFGGVLRVGEAWVDGDGG